MLNRIFRNKYELAKKEVHEGPSERYGPFKDVQVLWESGTKAGRRGGQNNIAEELGLSPSRRPCQQPAWNVCQVLGVLHVIVAQTLQRKGAPEAVPP